MAEYEMNKAVGEGLTGDYGRASIARKLELISGDASESYDLALDQLGLVPSQVNDWILDTTLLSDNEQDEFGAKVSELRGNLVMSKTPSERKVAAKELATFIAEKFN